MLRKAIFLDKDGTLIPDIPYNVDPDKIELAEGVAEGLKLLKDYGYLFFIVSNQSGVAHGYFDEAKLVGVEQKIRNLLEIHQVELSGFYYCPHHPEGQLTPYNIHCDCRKPQPGLLVEAAKAHGLDLQKSWMVGDILNDVEAGNKAGCKMILIDNGNETEWEISPSRVPDMITKDIKSAAERIVRQGALDAA